MITTLIILLLIFLVWTYYVQLIGIIPCLLILTGIVLVICVYLCWNKIKQLYHKIIPLPDWFKWILFVAYTIALLYPIIPDVCHRITTESLSRHLYILILGGVLLTYIVCHLIVTTYQKFTLYRKVFTNRQQFSIWNNDNQKVDFWDYLWSSLEISKESLSWIRTYTTLFCYPLFIVCYIISLSKDWNKLYSAIGMGSICIAIFALWYAVNTTIRSKNAASATNRALKDMMPSIDPEINDKKWTKE